MPILDYRGQPVQTSKLTEEIATSSILQVRQPFFPSVANGLTPERLAAVVNGVDSNDANDYLTLADEMEEREPHYSSVLATRKRAVSRLKVYVEAASDDAQDVEVADFVRDVVKSKKFKDLINQQLDALGKGFAVSEIMWDRSGPRWEPKEYLYRDPRHFMFDRLTGKELRLRDPADLAYGIPLAPYKFVQHRPQLKMGLALRTGLARLALVSYLCKGYTIKDWLAFLEVFAMPIRVGKFDAAATPAQKAQLLTAVSMIGTDAAAIIPASMQIEFIQTTPGSNGDKLFQGMADWLDSQVSKAVLGQTMSADAKSTGLGSSNADVHNEVRGDIRDADAEQIAMTLSRDVVKPLVDLNFGPRAEREYPILQLLFEEPEDLKLLAESLPQFIDRGLRVQASAIRDKFGLEEPEDDEEVLTAKVSAAPTPPGGEAPPADGEDPTAEPAQEPAPNEVEQAAKAAKAAVLRRVATGKRLTKDQQALLSSMIGTGDEIDRLVAEELRGWKRTERDLLDPVAQIAESCSTFEEFQAKLATLALDPTRLAESLARLTFEARGLGDVKDNPKA